MELRGLVPVEGAIPTEEEKRIEEASLAECQKIYEKEGPANDAANNIRRVLFGITGEGATIYPTDFSGMQLLDGKLEICLTALDDRTISKYKEASGNPDILIFKKIDRSLTERKEIVDQAVSILRRTVPVHVWCAIECEDQVMLEVTDTVEAQKALQSIIKEKSYLANLHSPLSIEPGLFSIREGQAPELQANLYGGTLLNVNSTAGVNGPHSTVGCNGTINGTSYVGFVTNGHGMTTSGNNRNIYINGTSFGQTVAVRYSNGANGDFACVARTNTSFTLINQVYGTSTSNARIIVGVADEPTKNATIHKFGTIRGYAKGTVEYNNVSIDNGTASAPLVINGLTRVLLTEGTTTNGDSGGPYTTSSSGANFIFNGVHAALSKTLPNTCYFTPYARFKSTFTPYTK